MAIEDQDPQDGSPDAEPAADPSVDLGTAIDWDSPDNPYKQRFESYRPEADRRATRLSQFEQAIEDFRSGDPAEMRRAAAILGIDESVEIPEPEPEYDPDDPMAALQSQVNELSSWRSEREQRDHDAAMRQAVDAQLSKIEGLSPEDRDLVEAQAVLMSTSMDELPEKIGPAYEALVARDKARIEAAQRDWAKGKTPTSIAPGTTGTQQEDIMAMSREQLAKRDREAIERAALRMQES